MRGHWVAKADAAEAGEPMLVFLVPLDPPAAGEALPPPAPLRATDHGLEPAILAARVGQSVRFENAAGIYHHLFSYSESNPFDLGVLRRGDARSLELRGPGVVRIYCSLHPGEAALLFVAPTGFYTVVRPPEPWQIRDVPPGRYRIGAWGETSAAHGAAIRVASGGSVAVGLRPGRPAAGE